MIAGMLAGALGIVVVSRLPELPGAGGLVLLLVCSALACCLPLRWLRLAGCLGFGVLWACLRGHEALARALPSALDGAEFELRLCIEGLPQRRLGERGEQWRLRARLIDPLPGARGVLASWQGRRIDFSWYGPGEFAPGDAWRMRLRLRAPRGFVNHGGLDYQAWLLAQGVDATGYAIGKARHERLSGIACNTALDGWRHRLRTRLERHLGDEPQLGRLLAVTLGDASRFLPADWELFARTGTTHLMVISGMHITLVAALMIALVTALVRRLPWALLHLPARSWGVLAALPAALAYAILAGMGVSVQRALLMVVVAFLYLLRERTLQPWLTYASALLLVLVVQPLAALQSGFWLSFITVAALLLAYGGRIATPSRLELLWRPQLVVACALLCPLLLLGLPQAPLAPLVNALAIPLTDLLIVPSALLGCLLLPLGDVLAWLPLRVALLGLGLLDALLHLAAEHSPSVAGIAPTAGGWKFALAALGSLWLVLPPGIPGRVAAVALLLPLFGPARELPSLLELTMLDVGQGTAVIVRTATHTLVYDAGPRFSERFDAGSAIVAPALRAAGVRVLDRLLISHADADHAGGAAGLLAAFPADEVLGILPTDAAPARPCRRGDAWSWDGVEFQVLHPPLDFSASTNDGSCVLRIAAAGRVFLLAGDIERRAESLLAAHDRTALRADVLLVPHHGSRTSSSPGLIAAVAPHIALVSAGHRNRFGHPHPEVLARYHRAGVQVLETARHGAVRLRVGRDGTLAPPECWRVHHRRFWFETNTAPGDACHVQSATASAAGEAF